MTLMITMYLEYRAFALFSGLHEGSVCKEEWMRLCNGEKEGGLCCQIRIKEVSGMFCYTKTRPKKVFNLYDPDMLEQCDGKK